MNYQPAFSFPWLEELLACPACGAGVVHFEDTYICPACNRTYPIRYGIPDFRVAPDPYISIGEELTKIDGFFAPGRSYADSVKAYYDLTPESPPELHRHYIAAMDASVVRGAALVRAQLSNNSRFTFVTCINCRGGPQWPPVCESETTGGHGGPPLQLMQVYSLTFKTARKASCGISTRPTFFIRFLPSFCFSSSLRLRVMSPP